MVKQVIATGGFLLAILFFGQSAFAAGALAIDSNQGSRYGFAYDHASLSEAQQRAMNECGSRCRVVLRFENGCGAYAADQSTGSTVHGWGTASSGAAAQGKARSECRSRGGSSCTVRSWGCNAR